MTIKKQFFLPSFEYVYGKNKWEQQLVFLKKGATHIIVYTQSEVVVQIWNALVQILRLAALLDRLEYTIVMNKLLAMISQ